MKKTVIHICLVAVISLSLVGSSLSATAQQQPAQSTTNQPSSNQDNPEEEITPSGQVKIDGHPVLAVYEPVATLTPEARAQGIAARIIALARDTSIPAESVRLQPRDAWTEILADNTMIMAVTDADAKA